MDTLSSLETQDQRTLIAPEFDTTYYLTQLSKGAELPLDPIVHYLLQGWREGLDPSPHFSTSFYLDSYPDVQKMSINPLLHYLQSGKLEGRSPIPSIGDHTPESLSSNPHLPYEKDKIRSAFDEQFYVDQVPELRNSTVDPIIHYLTQGWRELWDPSPGFSTSYYLDNHPDVREAGINPLLHYMQSGRFEGRLTHPSNERGEGKATPRLSAVEGAAMVVSRGLIARSTAVALQDPLVFDIAYYRKKYAVVGDDTAVVTDFLLNPDRQGSLYFDPEWYAGKYLKGSASVHDALTHYIRTGRQDGNRPSPIFDGTVIDIPQDQMIELIVGSKLFDTAWYEHKNQDVVRAGADPLRHYVRVGHSEYKRSPNALFDNTWYVSHALDVRKYKWHPLVHYIMLGSDKDLSTHPLIDVSWLRKVAASASVTGPWTLLSLLLQKDSYSGFEPNEFFDSEYYESLEPQAKSFPGGSIAHFMEIGWKRQTNPSKRFNCAGYLRANPDVMTKGANPLLHFLTSGRVEGRNPCPEQTSIPVGLERFSQPEYGATVPVMAFDAEPVLPRDFSLSIAVHLHLYYVDMAEEFCERFDYIPVPFYLYVSVPVERGDPAAIQALFQSRLTHCTGVTVITPVNRGRDVAPFLVALGKDLLRYDLILHLHSKRSPHSPKHADWRRYLLHYTLGNRAIVAQILTAFHADPKVGVFQPPYHSQVQAQPKWGGNRDKVTEWLPRLGLNYAGDSCPDFPAGSFFWARTDALRPLLDGRIKLEDFDEESGQIDSTLAHALERLFGLVPVLRGYSVVCRFIDVAHNMINYYGKSRAFPAFSNDRNRDIIHYQAAVRARKGKRGRIAVVTAISGPFDALLLPDQLEPEIDYFCVSDTVGDGYGVFRILPLPYLDADSRRSARYVKTNLLRLFPGYEVAVWIDANVLVRSPIAVFVEATQAAGRCIGAIPHPTRRSYLEEAEVATELKLDDAELVTAQTAVYAEEKNLEEATLIETNFMVFDARRPQTARFTQLWWNQINTFSRRDQLSINYCLLKADANWHPLLPEFMSTRDSSHFALFRHGLNQWGPKPHIYSAWHVPHSHDGHLLPLPETHSFSKHAGRLDLDVVVCVHNALDDVRLCISSVDQALAGRGRLILVDDASESETASFLTAYAAEKEVHLIRHNERVGYTKAANAGVRDGTNRHVLLLNSDTIVPPGAFDKLSESLDRDPLLGIVGPLSNAASFQSVPSTAGTAEQTAINQLPPGMSVGDMDLFLERHWNGSVTRTPLVHGFCFCVKRLVFEQIGLFDEESFPLGYGEENDFCFRAADAGFDLGILTSTYVFHAKSKSYGETERRGLMDDGMAALIRKVTRPRITRAVETMGKQPAFAAAQQAVAALFTHAEAGSDQRRGRLFLLPSLRSDGMPAGSGYVRVLLPYRSEAVCRDWEVTELRTMSLPALTSMDTVLVQREAGLVRSEAVDDWIAAVRQAGARLIYEIDDDLLDGNSLKSRGFRGDTADLSRRVLAFARAADCVTVSSDALLTKFTTLNRSTTLVPNILDPDLWQLASELPAHLQGDPSQLKKSRITIGYVGTPTHGEDLALVKDAIRRLEQRFPGQLDIQVIGGFGSGEKTFGNVIALPRANDYPSFVRWLRKTARWDIGIVPLADSSFNKFKSYLKYVELSALGMAVLCSDGPEYTKVVENGRNGLLVSNTTQAWIDALASLVANSVERQRLATNGYQDVLEKHTSTRLAPHLLQILTPPEAAVTTLP